mgnify:CR=1 FL=1
MIQNIFKIALMLIVFLVNTETQAQDQSTVIDMDGNVYQTIIIGDQVWMKENLKATTFNEGTPIPCITDNKEWSGLSTPGYCWQGNNIDAYGALYNWYAVETGRLCPKGWHVAIEEDWKQLEIAVGMPEDMADKEGWRGSQGGKLAGKKESWVNGALKHAPDFGSSRFHGLPAGNRLADNGLFGNMSTNAFWWSATEHDADTALGRMLHYGSTHIIKSAFEKQYGYCVRCVKDQPARENVNKEKDTKVH